MYTEYSKRTAVIAKVTGRYEKTGSTDLNALICTYRKARELIKHTIYIHMLILNLHYMQAFQVGKFFGK
jgi:hypothetical protein